MEKIFLSARDGVKIAADFYPVFEKVIGWSVLVHMMPAVKESWRSFAEELQKRGYESIAIDLRGHGQSRTYADLSAKISKENLGGQARKDAEKLDYRKFSDEEHQKSILDLEAAVDYLVKIRKATPKQSELAAGQVSDRIIFIGASIGANLSLQYISERPEFKTAILLSPGLNYRGVKTEPMVQKLRTGQKVFFISSREDGDNAEENKKLYDLVPAGAGKKIRIYETGGHGTDILKNQPELTNLIIDFIE